jgi:hypothetical protein
MEGAGDEVVSGRIQQSFATEPQVRGRNIYFMLWDASNWRTNKIIEKIWLRKLDFRKMFNSSCEPVSKNLRKIVG